jgi:murein DD-endopeptidase MepM/ murein hydrolase activator NlpD
MLAGPLAVLTVGGVLATALVTGVPAGLAPTVASAAPAPDPTTAIAAVASLPDVTRALQALADTNAAATIAHTSRSHRRAAAPAARHRWVRPYWGVFTSPFGYRWGRLHAGIDLAGPYGSTFVAATDGCITYAGPMSGYGTVMKITDWDGTETVYGHMSSFIRTAGCVRAGQPIARIGATGDATGPHLHFEVRVGGVPINPVPFLAARGVQI